MHLVFSQLPNDYFWEKQPLLSFLVLTNVRAGDFETLVILRGRSDYFDKGAIKIIPEICVVFYSPCYL